MTNEERFSNPNCHPHYVLSPNVAVATSDTDPGWYFVLHNGKTVAAEQSDTRAIACADELHSAEVIDIATGTEPTDTDIAATLAIGDAVTRWNVHKQNGTLDSPEARAIDDRLAKCSDRWAMDRAGYLYLL